MFSAVVRVCVIWHNPLRDDKNNRIMNIKINNKTTETFASDLRELAKELGLPERGVAMALGGQMVQHDAWAATSLRDGDSVIIIKAVCGG